MIMYLVLIIAVILGIVLGIVDFPKNNRKGAHLNKLSNSDMSCGKAFDSLTLLNSWGEKKNEH